MPNQEIMKKFTLLAMVVSFSVLLFAQTDQNAPTLRDVHPDHIEHLMRIDPVDTYSAETTKTTVTQSKGLARISFASSANIYSLISPPQAALTAVPGYDGIVFFSRAGGPFGGSGNDLRISYSTDMGQSWDDHMVVPPSPHLMRYPGGGIFVPDASTSMDDCFAAFSGPITGGSGWTDNFFGSLQMDGSHEQVSYLPLEAGTYFAHANNDLQVLDDGSVHVSGDKFLGTEQDYSWGGGMYFKGQFNGSTNEFDWDPLVNMTHNFALDPDGDPMGTGARMAWSQDGSVGYYVFRGVDDTQNNLAYQPIIYKTTDGGQTWNLEPVFDFSTLDSITNYLWGTLADPTVTTAFFTHQMDLTVDNQGMLHIFSLIKGGYSTHPDSIGYTFTYEPNKLFHVNMTPGGGWEAELVTQMFTMDVRADDQIFGSGQDAMGWNHRINASRTEDGEKVFVVWSDTDTLLAAINQAGIAYINSSPDIWAYGKDLNDGTIYPPTDFTNGTQFWGDNYFHYASNITLVDPNGNMIIPVTIANIGSGPLDPVTHNLMKSIGFGPSVGVNEKTRQTHVSVSQNFPNPFNEQTNIVVNLKKQANLSLEVYNMLGQVVYSENKGSMAAGIHNFTVSAQNLKPGIYFYKVNAGENSATKKMIVK